MGKLDSQYGQPIYGFYTPHDPVYAPHSDEVITRQEFKDECDINNILSQYQMTEIIQHIAQGQASFEDLPNSSDYQTSLDTIMRAEEAFDALPSKVRDRYGNDPERFLGAFGDPEQAEYLREVGLLNPLPEPPIVPAPAPEPRAKAPGIPSKASETPDA